MADPVNLSDLESLFSPDRKPLFVGKPEGWWERTGVLVAENYAFVADSDCRGLVRCVLELQRDDFWRQYSDNWDEFCQRVFHRPAAWIEQVVEGVRVLHLRGEKGKVGAGQALAAVAQQTGKAGPAPAPGIPSPNPAGRRGKEQGNNGCLVQPRITGNRQDAIIRRIKRDHPDIAEQLERGEFRSARAAGLAAGFIKPSPPTIRLVDDPAKVAAALRKHLTTAQLQALVALLGPTGPG